MLHKAWSSIEEVPYSGLPSVTEFQYFVTEITLLLLKFSLNFGQNTEICLNFAVFQHKNTEIGVKFCKNTEMSAICYWSEFPEVGSPAYCFWRSSVKFQGHAALKIVEFDPN